MSMKKVFTLIAGMLLICGSVSAQKKWTNLVQNGDMSKDQPTVEEFESDESITSLFWCHEYREEDPETQFDGPARIVVDPLNENNRCAAVKSREGEGLDDWDSQFFVYVKEALPAGKQVRLTMRVRAEKEASGSTQAHNKPGDYNYWSMCGDISFKTDWTTFTWEGELTNNQCYGENKTAESEDAKEFHSIAINLACLKDGDLKASNTYYFDDIKLEVKDKQEVIPGGGYVNFFRKGTLSADKFGNFTTFTGRMGATNKDEQAVVVQDKKDGEPALMVTTVAWNTEGVLKNAEGTDSLDSDGNPVTAKYYIVDNDTILSSDSRDGKSFDDWRTQFFATVSHKFITGQNYKFKMWARAERVDGEPLEEEVPVATQAHNMPGQYKHWDFVGTLNLNEEWQEFAFGSDEEPKTIGGEANGCQTVAFNCNIYKDYPVNIYFRFDELSFEEGTILDSERVLDSQSVSLPLPAQSDETTVGTFDLAEAMKTLEVEGDINHFVEDTKTLKVKYVNPETDDDTYADVDLTAGFNIDANGNWVESDANAIILELSNETAGNTLALNITNNGISLETGKSIDAKIAFEKDFWRYLFNVSFIDAEAYAGVSEVTVAPKNNVMYDLMGRQLTKAAKGLYIMNGKKVLVK